MRSIGYCYHMLYEFFAITRNHSLNEVKEFMFACGQNILQHGGVIQRADYLGAMMLPDLLYKHRETHNTGVAFTLRYFSNPKGKKELTRMISMDPRLLRHVVLAVEDKKVTPAK